MSPESLPAEFRSKGGNGMSEPAIAFGCTIFLDEISQLDFLGQDRLLQLLLEAELIESGSYFGARLISATTRDLEGEMCAGRFRRELYYRISGVHLRLPALRDRKEDIPALLDLFLHKYAILFGRAVPTVDDSVLDATLQYSWAGNVRELENFARTIVAVGDATLALSHLGINGEVTKPVPRLKGVTTSPSPVCSLKQAAREASRKAERELILKALERTRWNRKRTALELQISYKALLYKLKQMNLDGSDGSKV
jgi:two-component system response regulator AtoC